jgi:hypothetical protein
MDEKSMPPENNEVAGELRGQLVKRLAVAASMVAVLLGVLAVFDRLASNGDEFESPVFTQPVPVAPKKEVTQPVMPVTNLPEPPIPPAPPEPPVAEVLPPVPQIEEPVAVPEVKSGKKVESRQENRLPARSTATDQVGHAPSPVERAPRPSAADSRVNISAPYFSRASTARGTSGGQAHGAGYRNSQCRRQRSAEQRAAPVLGIPAASWCIHQRATGGRTACQIDAERRAINAGNPRSGRSFSHASRSRSSAGEAQATRR